MVECKKDIHLSPALSVICLLSAIVVLSNACATRACAQSEDIPSSSSIVFVIDVSTSMLDIMDELKDALKDYVRESEPGQSIAIVTFGRNAKLLYRKTIRGASDKERILKFCDGLSCEEEYTYIPAGMRRGVEEVQQFYRENPEGTHNLVLMSDGKNNPPTVDDPDDIVTYESIKDEFFSQVEPGRDLYVSYVALKGMPDNDLKDFVEECRGYMTELHAEEKQNLKTAIQICEAEIQPALGVQSYGDSILDLGSASAPTSIRIPLIVKPKRGNVVGKRLLVNPIITNGASREHITATAVPNEIECTNDPRKIEIVLSIFGAWEDDIYGALLFQPLEQSIFIVSPTQFKFVIKSPPRFLVGIFDESRNEAQYDRINWVALGPLEPGGECSRKLSFKLKSNLPSDEEEKIEIRAVPTIKLPDGVTCTAKVDVKGLLRKNVLISVTASASPGARIEEGRQFVGNLALTSSHPSVIFSQGNLPLKVFTPGFEEDDADWDLSTRGGDYSAPIKMNWKAMGAIVLVSIVFVGLLAGWGYARFMAYARKFIPLEGWLVVFERPQKEDDIQNIDMGNLSQTLKKQFLVIGSESSSDIHIPHASVGKSHAQLRAGREGTPTPAYIKSLGLNDIKINNYVIDEEIKLRDGDTIGIGDYQFLYSNSYMKQVVVHYKDGDVKYGVPLSWNIEEDGFTFQPTGEDADKFRAFIPFKDLKAVFFVKAFDKEMAKKIRQSSTYKHKDHIIVKFKDGEKIEGYTIKDYDEKAPRFFMVPKDEPGKEENNICVLVERRFTKGIKVVERVG